MSTISNSHNHPNTSQCITAITNYIHCALLLVKSTNDTACSYGAHKVLLCKTVKIYILLWRIPLKNVHHICRTTILILLSQICLYVLSILNVTADDILLDNKFFSRTVLPTNELQPRHNAVLSVRTVQSVPCYETMEPIERSETSASNTQTPGNYPKETVLLIQYQYSWIVSQNVQYRWSTRPQFTRSNLCVFIWRSKLKLAKYRQKNLY
jgi:hypothetical protein